MYKLICSIATYLLAIAMSVSTVLTEPTMELEVVVPETIIIPVEEAVQVELELVCETENVVVIEVIEEIEMIALANEEAIQLSREEIELIALVTMAEAEGECELGKRLVIDTILNRVDSDLAYMPDTVHEVIYQKDQFTSMWNGRIDRVEVVEEICKLVEEELANRTNSDVLYFHAKRYGKFGTPMFAVGNHYFSG